MAHDMSFTPNFSLSTSLAGKTAIVTGGANGIGLEVIRKYYSSGANVVIADLPSAQPTAERAIQSLGDDDASPRAMFVPVNITDWDAVNAMFASAIDKFGRVDIVVANAGIMESREFFNFQTDEAGRLIEDESSSRVIDVNLKGTMNSNYVFP